MYTPRHFALDDDRVRALLASAETAQLVTAHEHGPVATLLPVVWRPDASGEGLGSLILHVTRVNPVWRDPYLGDALAIQVVSYKKLGQDKLAADSERVLKLNFPNHPYFAGDWPHYRSNWWRLLPLTNRG